MSGNVSQMVNLLEMCLLVMGFDFNTAGSVIKPAIDAVSAVHKVYVGMQVRLQNCLRVQRSNGAQLSF